MSGKGRQPRVKGNLKPTSSSRAADLLEGDMAAINAFKANPALAFSQLSRAAPSPRQSSKSTTPEANSRSSTPGPALDQIDGHLASQLKRLGKHDSKTKMRALFELKGYVAEHTWEDGLEGMMLAWPPLFRKHIFDPDRRVRAAVATVNAALVKSAGKRLAPNLKQLIGAWIASYFDPHREVAKTSKKAYETVFPESRRKEVFAYCMDELVDFAVDNIVNQTPETLSDPRFADAEEMKSKFEQVIGASFGILGLVIEEVESDKVVEAKAKFDEVLGSKKAMQFLASPATFIRRAVYRFIRSAMLGCPQLAQDSYLQLTQALVSNAFVDNDPTAHGDMWDAVLLTTKNYPQAWSEITAKGKKTPPVARLFAFLSSRCRMAPTISYPSILALLANLPADILDEPAFSSEFRGALWQGAAASDEAAAATKIGARAVQVESISLASALCECLSFLWQRSLKAAGPAGIDSVSKEAAQELDRLWHFYLQNGDVAEEMTGAFVALYCKIEVLAEKYGTVLMDKIWAQTSWFALKRLSGDSAAPVVHLVAQIRALDAKQHGPLVENAKKLVVAFCQLAAQSPDDQTAQGLIQTLAQHAPDVVFREGFADKFSVRLEKSGACDEAIDLVLSKAQYVMANTGSLAEAVASLDEFVRMPADSADDGNGTTLRLVTALLKALPGSQISRNGDFTSARLPSLDALIVSSIPSIPSCADDILSASFESPPSQLLQLYSQALQLSFCGTVLVSPQTVNVVFGWMESVFKMQYEIQWEDKKSKSSSLDSWIRTIHEVLSSWTALANDRMAGPRFVRFWLTRTDNNARSALGLLFDMALSSAHGETGPDSTLAGIAHARLYPQAKRAWLATESQLEKLHLGSELAHALSESISEDLGDLATLKNPSHLARLAHSVFARICPQDDTKAIKSLIRRWLLDELSWKGALQGDAQAVLGESALVDDYLGQTALGSAALSQAINEPLGAMSLSFHSLGQWSVASLASKGLNATDHQQRFDMYGLSRFARRAMFSVEFLQLSGGLVVLSDASNEALSTLILNMTLAYVLLRETLAAYKHDAEDSDSATSGSIGIVQLDDGDNALYARISAAAKMIEGTVSDILSLLVVHGFSLPKSQSGDDDNEEAVQIKIPHDSGRWLSTLVSRVLSTGDASLDNDVSDSVWDILIITCIARHRQAPQSQWARVLATLSEWCQWANPLNSADVEAAMAVPLSSDLPKILELPALVDLTTLVARSVSLRHACPQSPALRGTLIDLTGSLTRTINGKAASATSLSLKLVVALELLAELLPPQRCWSGAPVPALAELCRNPR
ncbi:hypothetical protein DL89DRAFT_113333 [Linderina pennispora]|uniref:E3 ubiquitin-protein ligase listerin n=1 Tax=Linderina pennispora TaxID=61395 RepID=A0A1Y1WFZ5_9FUNG|nr:uncharacterized protein DL89DRAFT_113333 [Linderina pennispora]ORX72453.1 hypothetical protein DL89DRAFT_113333 [Linderina pennispora]